MKRLNKETAIRISIVLLLVLVMIVGLAFPILAKGNQEKSGKSAGINLINIIKGEITEVNNEDLSFDVFTADDEMITVVTDSETVFFVVEAAPYANTIKEKIRERLQQENTSGNRLSSNGISSRWNEEIYYAMQDQTLEDGLVSNAEEPRGVFNRIKSWFGLSHNFGEAADFTDITEGDGVIVRVMPDNTLAKHVLIIKPSQIGKIDGLITEIDGNSITVTNDNEEITVEWNEDTRVTMIGAIAVEEGQNVSLVYNKEAELAMIVKILPD